MPSTGLWEDIRCCWDGWPYNAIFKWQNNMLWIIWLLSRLHPLPPPYHLHFPETMARLASRVSNGASSNVASGNSEISESGRLDWRGGGLMSGEPGDENLQLHTSGCQWDICHSDLPLEGGRETGGSSPLFVATRYWSGIREAQEALSHDSVGHYRERCLGSGTHYRMRKLQHGRLCVEMCVYVNERVGGRSFMRVGTG